MLSVIVTLLILALVLYLVFWVSGMFLGGRPQQIVGVICFIIWVFVALQKLGFAV